MESEEKFWVCATDRFMSGWGHAEGKINKLVLSCNSHSEALVVAENAENRSDMEDVEILDFAPSFDEGRFLVSWHGRDEGDYESWFKPGWFAPVPKMGKREIENAKRVFLCIGKVFTESTQTITQELHDKAVDARLVRLLGLSKSGLTGKQIEDFTFKLTDAEKISLLSKASCKAPLRREYAEEMQRLFLRVYGEEAYRSIFGYKDPPEKEQGVEIWGNK